MKIRTFSLAFSIFLIFPIALAVAKGSSEEPGGGTNKIITLSRSLVQDATAFFEQSDPERRSYEENRWNTAYLNEGGIKLINKWISPDADSNNVRWNTAIASNDVPDFAVVDINTYKKLYDAGLIKDMTDIYPKAVSNELREMTLPDYLAYLTIGGRLYGMPLPQKTLDGSTLYVRQDWLDKLGLKMPKTILDVLDTAKAFKDARLGGDNTIGLLMGKPFKNGVGQWDGIANPYGAYFDLWLEKEGQLVYSNAQPEVKQFLQVTQDLYKKGLINKDFAVIDSNVAREYIAGGKTGMTFGHGSRIVVEWLPLFPADPKADVTSTVPYNAKGEPSKIQISYPAPKIVFINSKCKNPEAVVQLANITVKLYRQDAQKYFRSVVNNTAWPWFKYIAFGDTIVPFTFDVDVGNAIRMVDKTGDKKNIADGAMLEYYNRYIQGQTARNMHQWVDAYGEGGSQTVQYDAYHEGRMFWSAFYGLPTETMLIKQKIINDELTAVMTEIIMGADVNNFDKAVQKWLAGGGQKITDEVNAWYKAKKK
jgi:putative aldouronate transport system substrate-binding protein